MSIQLHRAERISRRPDCTLHALATKICEISGLVRTAAPAFAAGCQESSVTAKSPAAARAGRADVLSFLRITFRPASESIQERRRGMSWKGPANGPESIGLGVCLGLGLTLCVREVHSGCEGPGGPSPTSAPLGLPTMKYPSNRTPPGSSWGLIRLRRTSPCQGRVGVTRSPGRRGL
jgi:hypothetical protein